jgi:hypothetical protein
MHLRLTSLALAILLPASAAVPPVHNLLTDATPESAAAAAMRAYVDPAMAELPPAPPPAVAMQQLPIPSQEPDDNKIDMLNLLDGEKGALFHDRRQGMVVASLGKDWSSQTDCPEGKKRLSDAAQISNVAQRHDNLKGNANGQGAEHSR